MRATSSVSGKRRSALRPAMRLRPSSERLCVSSVSMKPGAIAVAEIQPSLGTSDISLELIAHAPRRRYHVVTGAGKTLDDREANTAAAAGDENVMHRCAPVCRPG